MLMIQLDQFARFIYSTFGEPTTKGKCSGKLQGCGGGLPEVLKGWNSDELTFLVWYPRATLLWLGSRFIFYIMQPVEWRDCWSSEVGGNGKQHPHLIPPVSRSGIKEVGPLVRSRAIRAECLFTELLPVESVPTRAAATASARLQVRAQVSTR